MGAGELEQMLRAPRRAPSKTPRNPQGSLCRPHVPRGMTQLGGACGMRLPCWVLGGSTAGTQSPTERAPHSPG